MENLLQGTEGVVVYLDDILVSGATEQEHMMRLEEVLGRLERAGLRVQKSKYLFGAPSVEFLGHKVDGEGLHPLADKVEAVVKAPSPQNAKQLKAYLGLLTYYSQFLPSLSTVVASLYSLLCSTRIHAGSGVVKRRRRFSNQRSCSHQHSVSSTSTQTCSSPLPVMPRKSG